MRTHVSLGKDAPCTRPIERFGDVVAHPILGGLHHRYEAKPLVIGVALKERLHRRLAEAAASLMWTDLREYLDAVT